VNAPSLDLLSFPDFFDLGTCRELISEMRLSPVSAAVIYSHDNSGRIDESVRKVSRVLPSQATVLSVVARLIDCKQRVEEHFSIKLSDCEEPQFLCYRVGDFFVAHQDGNTGLLRLDSDRTRRISVSIFLNQESDVDVPYAYRGGSLVFSDWGLNRKVPVKAEAGTLLAFRSEVTHEVLPVTQGERYSIVTWYGSR
jgi:SM-20-related protein